MQTETIKPSRQADVIAALWRYLLESEQNARDSKSRLDELDAEGLCRLWNDITGDDHVVFWKKQANDPINGSTG